MKERTTRSRASVDVWRPYALATSSVAVAVCLRFLLIPILGPERLPFLMQLPSIVFCAAYCGVGPSILALVLSEFAAFYFFSAPVFTFRLQYPLMQIGGMTLFALNSIFIIWLGQSRRRALGDTQKRIQEATAELSLLTARLLQVQDEERRRIARSLHDSVGQLLAAMSMNLGALQSMNCPAEALAKVKDNRSLVDEASHQIRTISHLLHPPLLEEVGLVCALKCLIDGFSTRSGIQVTLDAADGIERYDSDVEIAMFRVVQECLSNIHRHSGSPTANVSLCADPQRLKIIVRDQGHGIPAEKLNDPNGRFGVGLCGMKQRIVQLGGELEVQSDNKGVVLTASVPAQVVSQVPVRRVTPG